MPTFKRNDTFKQLVKHMGHYKTQYLMNTLKGKCFIIERDSANKISLLAYINPVTNHFQSIILK